MKPGSWASDLVDLVLPPGCVTCGAWISSRGPASLLCARCRSRLQSAPWPRCPRCHFPLAAGRVEATDCFECRPWPAEISAARYAQVLAPPADDLVHALKYEGWPELAVMMGEAMARVALPAVASLVVPTPTTPRRLESRGYNQAELLAGTVAARLALPLRRALERRSEGRSQTSLTPVERRDNVRGVFSPARGDGSGVEGADVLLVDDVLTTGATAGEAAGVLAGMGARSVTLLTYARALPTTLRRPG